ncbi:MAG: LytTR family DNA-binding domain-containing protein [Halofilum sp. (in: g-proteobacteria)]|nr:LytTR family DNA-binding domain-containing protein [Halofilum sp. (in: g-proteobacteria)]
MKVLIVDDEAPARARLARLVADIGSCELVGEAADGRTAVAMTARDAPDVLLLDIRMPGMDGLEVARHVALAEPPPAVIFTTAYGDHALEAFETHAAAYLLKPIRAEKLAAALEGATRHNRAQLAAAAEKGGPRTQLCAHLGGELELVPVADVLYFRAEHKYVTVRHREGELLIEESLKSLEEEFGDRFLRIHRNALVLPAAVGGLRSDGDRHRVWFHDLEETLEVSRRHLPSVRRVLRQGRPAG